MSLAVIFKKCKVWLVKFIDKYLRGKEPALVVSWADIAILLLFTMLAFAVFGPMLDRAWLYIHSAPSNFYTAGDVQTVDSLYDIFRFIPFVALGVVIIYAINYSNLKKGD